MEWIKKQRWLFDVFNY